MRKFLLRIAGTRVTFVYKRLYAHSSRDFLRKCCSGKCLLSYQQFLCEIWSRRCFCPATSAICYKVCPVYGHHASACMRLGCPREANRMLR